jgi:hypothetical protein
MELVYKSALEVSRRNIILVKPYRLEETWEEY